LFDRRTARGKDEIRDIRRSFSLETAFHHEFPRPIDFRACEGRSFSLSESWEDASLAISQRFEGVRSAMGECQTLRRRGPLPFSSTLIFWSAHEKEVLDGADMKPPRESVSFWGFSFIKCQRSNCHYRRWKMKGHSPLSKIWTLIIFVVLAIFGATLAVAQTSNIKVWATDPTGSYPVVLGTGDWVLIGTALGENFEKDYIGKKSLETLLLQSILQISSDDKPTVAVFSGGDSSDIVGMKTVMKTFVTSGYITSFDLTAVSPRAPLDVSLYALAQYNVVILDPPTCKGLDWQFIITEDSQRALARYLENGGKIVASAYLFVYWNAYSSSGKKHYNEELSTLLFDGAKPDINAYSPRAITNSPLGKGETILTLNAEIGSTGPKDPLFHSFWKLEYPVKK